METRRVTADELTEGMVVRVKIGRTARVERIERLTHPRLRMPVRVTWDEDGTYWERDYPKGCLFVVHANA